MPIRTLPLAADSDAAKWLAYVHRSTNKRWEGSRSRKKPRPLPEALNEFQAKVAMILDAVFHGIHNAPVTWERAEWYRDAAIVTLDHDGGRFSTYDFDKLTQFVFLCHAARIRGAITAGGLRSLSLTFHQRAKGGGMTRHHPGLVEAVYSFDKALPACSALRYRSGLPMAIDPAVPPETEG